MIVAGLSLFFSVNMLNCYFVEFDFCCRDTLLYYSMYLFVKLWGVRYFKYIVIILFNASIDEIIGIKIFQDDRKIFII